MINKESVVVAAKDLTVTGLSGEVIVLNVSTGMYFGLNEVGARILELIKEPAAVGTVVSEMLHEYEVSSAVLEQDVLASLNELHTRKLVRIVS